MAPLELPAVGVILFGVVFFLYTYFGYPGAVWLLGRLKPLREGGPPADSQWPTVSIAVPVYNEEHQIESLIRSLLSLEYPRDRLQILIVSDGSTDRTDEIVSSFADEGVDLLRMPERGGKTKAENAAAEKLRGEIVVNTDASIRIAPDALKPLVSRFQDPGVGLASGRDVSVDLSDESLNVGESGYVGYEMAIRTLETRLSGIVGASGCFYAIRPDLHRIPLPDHLSRDFAAALHTREHGLRAVSVPEAVCSVPRTASLRREYRRKVRTISRGMDTLYHKRALLNPLRHSLFAWMLFSHKVCRWLLPWVALATLAGLGVLSLHYTLARIGFAAGILFLVLAWIGWYLDGRREVPKVFSIPAFLMASNLAAAHALVRFLHGDHNPTWEPTRR
jgi:cellulose synthase/poly-beta-1,6-N-acetylglucosamine synthase-like glycosyltransferase